MATEDTSSSTESTDQQTVESTTETGLDSNVAGALSYLFGFVTGILFYLLEPEDEFVRFHASQSIVLSAAFFALAVLTSVVTTVLSVGAFGGVADLAFGLISLLVSLVWLLVALGGFVLWLFLMIRAYQGKQTRLPIVAGIADSIA